MALGDSSETTDPTPVLGAAADAAGPTHLAPKPPHERTADEERGRINWERLARTEKFQRLLRAKRRFVVPAMIFFVLYYFALPVLVGYAPRFMERRVMGAVNIAYLFALSQFFMAWAIAWLYVRAAARFDRMSQEVLEQPGSE